MTNVLKYISPKSQLGSFIASVLFHGLVALTVLSIFKFSPVKVQKTDEYLDLGYQTFDEPPVPVHEEKQVKNIPEPQTPVETKTHPDTVAKELQDDKGPVAGTQAAAPAAPAASQGNGQATATPYYKIKPKYPRAALQAGTEGWVLMKIDIAETGEVENIEVVDGEQRNLFQNEARRAVSQWKYKPFVDEHGLPFRKVAHQVRVDFKLNETNEL
jgi:protein TonB